jgi:Flp pilus assembly protein TadG
MNQLISRCFRGVRISFLERWKGLRGDAGSSLVEMSLMLAIFGTPMLLGTVETATWVYGSIEVSNAAHTGAMYGMTSSTLANDSDGIIAAAQSDASDFGTNLTVTPTVYYACSAAIGGTQYSTQTAATTACTGAGNHPLEFVQVVATAPVTPPIHIPGLPKTFTLNGTSVMEVEE